MEYLLHYTWKHRLFPLKELFTTDGLPVEVVDVGLHNTDSGPDFFNAKIKIDGTMWVGNVEIHEMLTAASGALVPMATTVRPMMSWGMPNFAAIDAEPSTKKSAPLTRSTNPNARRTT